MKGSATASSAAWDGAAAHRQAALQLLSSKTVVRAQTAFKPWVLVTTNVGKFVVLESLPCLCSTQACAAAAAAECCNARLPVRDSDLVYCVTFCRASIGVGVLAQRGACIAGDFVCGACR